VAQYKVVDYTAVGVVDMVAVYRLAVSDRVEVELGMSVGLVEQVAVVFDMVEILQMSFRNFCRKIHCHRFDYRNYYKFSLTVLL